MYKASDIFPLADRVTFFLGGTGAGENLNNYIHYTCTRFE
jgi:hypothetical protein